jgi:predicted metal-dependent hydrolase
MRQMKIGKLTVEVVRKDIKNLHLGVYPPNGRVRVAAPMVVNDEAVRLAVIDKLGWIKRQRASFAAQPRQSQRDMVDGESHYFLGRRYRLRVHQCDEVPRVSIRGIASLDLFVRPFSDAQQREAVLMHWHRAQCAVESTDTAVVDSLAAHPGRASQRMGRQADEDQMGQLQRSGGPTLVQPGVDQKTAAVFGIHRGA